MTRISRAVFALLTGAVLVGCGDKKTAGEPLPCPFACAPIEVCEAGGGMEVFPPADAGYELYACEAERICCAFPTDTGTEPSTVSDTETEDGTSSDTESTTRTAEDTGTGTELDTSTEPATERDSGTDQATEPDTGTARSTESATESESETERATEGDSDTSPSTDTSTPPDTATGTVAIEDTGTHSEGDTETRAGTERATGGDTASITDISGTDDTGTVDDSALDTGFGTLPDTDSVTDTGSEPLFDAGADTETDTVDSGLSTDNEDDSDSETGTSTSTGTGDDTGTGSDTGSGSDSASESDSETADTGSDTGTGTGSDSAEDSICRYDHPEDCLPGTVCTAVSLGMEGVCAETCDALPEGCPDTAPACEDYERLGSSICVERGLGGVERCGRLMPVGQAVGRPCPESSESTGCDSQASSCLSDVVDEIPGFCSAVCDPTAPDPCPEGARCAYVPGSGEAYCLPVECECLALPDLDVGEVDALKAALDALELTRCDIAYTFEERQAAGADVANDPFRISLTGLVRNEALAGARIVREQLDALGDGNSLSSAIRLAAAGLDQGREATPYDFSTMTFCEAVTALFAGSGDTPPTCDDLAPVEASIPSEMRAGITEIIAAAGWAAEQRNAALPESVISENRDALLDSLHALMLADGTTPPSPYEERDILLDYDLGAVYEAAAVLAEVIDTALIAPSDPDSVIDVTIDTPLGLIVIRGDSAGSADNTYCDNASDCDGLEGAVVISEPLLLLIDTGGDDTYLIPAGVTQGFAHAVSTVIDLGGNDRYTYSPSEETGPLGILPPADSAGRVDDPDSPLSLSLVSRQGASRGGIGFLIDRGEGSDLYESLRMSQGFGMLGVGALTDDGCRGELDEICEDRLVAESFSQGAGLFGIGVVLTGDNHATYEGLFLVQGAGGPRGAGVLVDRSGDDTYLAHPGDADNIFVTAPVFDETGNWSAAQGAGIGLPSDTPANGGDLSGGLGMLVDFAGTDDYSAGVMAGGAGYWHGIGILVEGNGGDHFETHGAAQGTGLDFGVGVLAEQAGDDVYNSDAGDEARVLGSGYNFGVGLVIEESGGDEYHSADNSLGTGDLNGTGVVIENGGNDIYTVTGTNNLGKAALTAPGYEPEDNPRRAARTIGLFVDAAGSDTYTGRADNASIANGSVWTQQAGGAGGDSLIEWGIGADTEGGTGVSTIE